MQEYQKAIDHLMTVTDWKAVAVQIAKIRPDIFNDAVVAVGEGSSKKLLPADLQEIKSLFNSGRRVDAVWAYRQLMNVSLMEAKDAVEDLCLR